MRVKNAADLSGAICVGLQLQLQSDLDSCKTIIVMHKASFDGCL